MPEVKNAWLEEFLVLRDKKKNSADFFEYRSRAGGREYLYDQIHFRPIERWTAGHIRAALLSAAHDDAALFVLIPMSSTSRTDCASRVVSLRKSLELETGIYPAEWRLLVDKQGHMTLRISLYTAVEMAFFSDLQLLKPRARR